MYSLFGERKKMKRFLLTINASWEKSSKTNTKTNLQLKDQNLTLKNQNGTPKLEEVVLLQEILECIICGKRMEQKWNAHCFMYIIFIISIF